MSKDEIGKVLRSALLPISEKKSKWLTEKPYASLDVSAEYEEKLVKEYPYFRGRRFWQDFSTFEILWLLSYDAGLAEEMPVASIPVEAWDYIDDNADSLVLALGRLKVTGSVDGIIGLLHARTGTRLSQLVRDIDGLYDKLGFDDLSPHAMKMFGIALGEAMRRERCEGLVESLCGPIQRILWCYASDLPGLRASELVELPTDSVIELLMSSTTASVRIWKEYPFELFRRSDWIRILSDARFRYDDNSGPVLKEFKVLECLSREDMKGLLSVNPSLIRICPDSILPEQGVVLRCLAALKEGRPIEIAWRSLARESVMKILTDCGERLPNFAAEALERDDEDAFSDTQIEQMVTLNPSVATVLSERRIRALSAEKFVNLCSWLKGDRRLFASYDLLRLKDQQLVKILLVYQKEIAGSFDWKKLPIERVYRLSLLDCRFSGIYPDKNKLKCYAEAKKKKPAPAPKPADPPSTKPRKLTKPSNRVSREVLLEYATGDQAAKLSPNVSQVTKLVQESMSANALAAALCGLAFVFFVFTLFWQPGFVFSVVILIASLIYKNYIKNTKTVSLVYKVAEGWRRESEWHQLPLIAMSKCAKVWLITRSYSTDKKYNGGISWVADRAECLVSEGLPYPFKSNMPGACLKVGGVKFVAMPDCVYVISSGKVEVLTYNYVTYNAEVVNYAEMQSTPLDAVVAYQSYKIVNVDGGRDKRYNYNPMINICSYGRVSLTLGRTRYDFLLSKSAAARAMMGRP